MKRAIYPALLLALVLAVPALSQGGGDADVGKKVQVLEDKVADQEARLADLTKHVEATKKEAAKLANALAKAEKDGFTYPAPNTAAREGLLKGLQGYAKVASGKRDPAADQR